MPNSIFAANPDQTAVTRLFVHLKEKLNFDVLRGELIQKQLLRVGDDYVFNTLGRHYRCERLIKLLIKNELCTAFVEFLQDTPGQMHLYQEIRDFQDKMRTASIGNKKRKIIIKENSYKKVPNLNFFVTFIADFPGDFERLPSFRITDDLLQRHFEFLYMELKPREIADEMFQKQCISVYDHDDITDSRKKHKRLMRLLYVLKKTEKRYSILLYTLESNHPSVWQTLRSDMHQTHIPCK